MTSMDAIRVDFINQMYPLALIFHVLLINEFDRDNRLLSIGFTYRFFYV